MNWPIVLLFQSAFVFGCAALIATVLQEWQLSSLLWNCAATALWFLRWLERREKVGQPLDDIRRQSHDPEK